MAQRGKPPSAPSRHAKASIPLDEGNARRTIITEAARLFAKLGYDGVSMRDIARASGIRASSAYHHFESKEALFLAVHEAGIGGIFQAVEAAIAEVDDPWDRLEAAAVAHCEALLGASDFAAVATPYFPAALENVRVELRRQRDAYERVIEKLVEALPLPAGIDRKIFRLHLLGALNWVPTWYRARGASTPGEIGRQLVLMLRCDRSDSGASLPTRTAKRAGARQLLHERG